MVTKRVFKQRAIRRLYQIAARVVLLPTELHTRGKIMGVLNEALAELGALPFEQRVVQYAQDYQARHVELRLSRGPKEQEINHSGIMRRSYGR